MVSLNRRNLVAGAAALAVWPTARARGAEHIFKFGSALPASHPINVRMLEAADRLKRETDGRFELQVFPSSQLGGDTEMLGQVRAGAIQMMTASPAVLSTLVPVASINTLGFVFASEDQVWAAMDGKLGEHLRSTIVSTANSVFAFDRIWNNGFRQITSGTRPIRTAADLDGFKIRVPISPLYTSMFKALGAAPVGINFAEVYTALQTKVVDGQENPLSIVDTAKLYEVQRYCSLTNHMWDGWWMLANRRAFERLPADLQERVRTAINEAALRQRADISGLNASLQTALAGRNMSFNTPDAASFRARLAEQGFYKEWRARYGETAWGLLEAQVGALA
jgi:tripartite ATP-independent transporter DctP family solute receptor